MKVVEPNHKCWPADHERRALVAALKQYLDARHTPAPEEVIARELGICEKCALDLCTTHCIPVTLNTRTVWAGYKHYLNSREWEITRRLALEHYGRSCCLCGKTKKLQVHHRHYRTLGSERLADLIVLCDTCHRKHHGKAA